MKHKNTTPRMLMRARLAEMASEFDHEFVADTFGPPPPAAQAKWERARRKRGRPKKGQGVKVISVSVELALLHRSDELARRMGITRADIIDRGLHAVLAAAGESR